MKYELFDKVSIKKYWRQQNQTEQLKEMGIDDLEKYLKSDDMAGDVIEFKKMSKIQTEEVGIVVGRRKIKTAYRLWHEYQESIKVGLGYIPEIDRISQESSTYEPIYLVATKMNCLRKVSFDDIVFIGDD